MRMGNAHALSPFVAPLSGEAHALPPMVECSGRRQHNLATMSMMPRQRSTSLSLSVCKRASNLPAEVIGAVALRVDAAKNGCIVHAPHRKH